MSEHPRMTAYLADARWFAGKGREYDVVRVERVGTLPGPPAVTVDLLTVRYPDADGSGETAEIYQMPLVHYAEPQERLGHALIGPHVDEELGGEMWAYDAVHDRDAMAVYLSSFAQTPENGAAEHGAMVFHRLSGHELDLEARGSLFSGEQSNSSVAFGEDSLLKVFRKVTPGRNPDIEIHAVLTEAENPHVAALYGWVETAAGQDETLDLGLIQQFLRTASDGWDLALSSARAAVAGGEDSAAGDFTGEAERLGVAVAAVHEVLAERFPTHTWGPEDVPGLADAMIARLDAQAAVVPELTAYVDTVRPLLQRVATVTEPVRAQRVHGDLHLGQTLRTTEGWKLVDFEGEPAKSLAERVLPDSPYRDVAGMLRSFDYAAVSAVRDLGTGGPDVDLVSIADHWNAKTRAAFLSGYLGRPATDDEQVLLSAYEADKAVYEVGYEARFRPGWLAVPLAFLGRLAPITAHLDHQQEDDA